MPPGIERSPKGLTGRAAALTPPAEDAPWGECFQGRLYGSGVGYGRWRARRFLAGQGAGRGWMEDEWWAGEDPRGVDPDRRWVHAKGLSNGCGFVGETGGPGGGQVCARIHTAQ